MRVLSLLPLLLLMMAMMGCGPESLNSHGKTNRVGVDEFAQLVDRGDFLLLDVRTPEEFSAGHIPGAINLNIGSSSFLADLRASA